LLGGNESRVVAPVNEDPSSELAAIELCPPTASGIICVVRAFPGELHPSPLLVVATVHPTYDHPELELAALLVREREVPGNIEVDEVRCPQLHLGDPPATQETRIGRTAFTSHYCHAARFFDEVVDDARLGLE